MPALLPLAPRLISVDRTRFWLTLWAMKRGRFCRLVQYEIAVGAVGHRTPNGLYFVQAKSKTPSWRAPNADWVPVEDRGKVFIFDSPDNPFAGGFISLGGHIEQGIGIHGTKFDPQLGTRASHGCIRMATGDLVALYRRVPLGTPVFVY